MVSLAFLLTSGGDLLQSLERKAYDLGVAASGKAPSDRIAVIAIDDQSIANIGRWPWPRDVHAKMVDILSQAKVKIIGSTALFIEPQIDPGLVYIGKLIDLYAPPNAAGENVPPAAPSPDLAKFGAILQEAEDALNTDRKLAESFANGKNVVLPMVFDWGAPLGKPDQALPEFVFKNALTQVKPGGGEGGALPTLAVQFPIESLAQSAVALGHVNVANDVDGAVRSEPLAINYYDQYFPSLALMIAAKSLNLDAKNITVTLGENVQVGNLKIGVDESTRMYTHFYKGTADKPAFVVDSFFDVFIGKIPPDKYRDKIVLIGATALGVGSSQVTPVSSNSAPVITLAHTVSSILQQHFFVVPGWAKIAEFGIFLLIAVYLTVLLPRLKAALGFAATVGIFAALVGAHFLLMAGQGLWVQLMIPATLLLVGHGLLTTKHFLVTERGKEKSEAESAESNRMLGLAFQGQGQLDMAFDKFRKVPMDAGMMQVLYNLALDFERKRQFNKAESVYQHMYAHDPKYKDLEQKMGRAKNLSETVMLGGGGASSAIGGTVIMEGGGVEKPMLGRYQIEKELGKGAMGVVYLGKDPKIGRVVAIKTMALAQEFEADELEAVKERFFREAETAGRLSHPNIVTIYDAGEEHDLAYIAMELLKGKDLVPYAKAANLLPLPTVMSVVARVAEALDYAHSQNVVHRDIKPANVMYDPESDSVKVADFGIARITDSSKTKTGMVLGTPSFMSPEQLAGAKITGQSDLFSLGVSLYQLCCGELPFKGESMTQLMYKIATEPPADLLAVRADIPPCLLAIIMKSLEKDVAKRYQTGGEMARDLRACMAEESASGSGAAMDIAL